MHILLYQHYKLHAQERISANITFFFGVNWIEKMAKICIIWLHVYFNGYVRLVFFLAGL